MDDWTRIDDVVATVLEAFGGVAPTRAFVAAGMTREQLAAVFRRGGLDRPRKGWYVDPALPWQAKCAVRTGGILACASAVDVFGLPVPQDAARLVHVELPASAPRVRHHRDRRHYVVPGEDARVVRHWSGPDGAPLGWRTTLVDALLQLAGCVPVEWWIGALDAALHRPRGGEPLLSAAGWEELVARVPERLHPALALVDPSSESILESLLRLGMRRRVIAPVVPQFSPVSAYRVDFLVGSRLILEADGAAFHDPVADASRDAVLSEMGYTVLRFGWQRITTDLDGVLDEIETALAALVKENFAREVLLQEGGVRVGRHGSPVSRAERELLQAPTVGRRRVRRPAPDPDHAGAGRTLHTARAPTSRRRAP